MAVVRDGSRWRSKRSRQLDGDDAGRRRFNVCGEVLCMMSETRHLLRHVIHLQQFGISIYVQVGDELFSINSLMR